MYDARECSAHMEILHDNSAVEQYGKFGFAL